MKKRLLNVAFAVAVGSFLLSACSNGAENETKTKDNTEVSTTEYHCPMQCEGEKTYTDKDIKCPECGMDLVAKE